MLMHVQCSYRIRQKPGNSSEGGRICYPKKERKHSSICEFNKFSFAMSLFSSKRYA